MRTSEPLRAYIADHPDCSAEDIAKALGRKTGSISAYLCHMHATGVYTRREARSAHGRAVYRYRVAAGPTAAPVAPPVAPPVAAPTPTQEAAPLSLQALVGQLAVYIAAQVMAEIQKELRAQVQALLPQPSAAAKRLAPLPMPGKPSAPEENTRMKRVLIVGLLPQQAGLLSQEFGECLDLRFFEGGNPSRLAEMAASADLIASHVNHSRHSYEEAIKQTSVPYMRVTGGMTAMREALTKYYVYGVM